MAGPLSLEEEKSLSCRAVEPFLAARLLPDLLPAANRSAIITRFRRGSSGKLGKNPESG